MANANADLIRGDGWVRLGDLVTIDDEGYLSVVGRSDDFIIRGGKNISALAVEQQVMSHPGVALAAAVAMPDEVFGERVCVFVEPKPGRAAPELAELTLHLRGRNVSKETLPERLVILDQLPRFGFRKRGHVDFRQTPGVVTPCNLHETLSRVGTIRAKYENHEQSLALD